MSNSDKELSLDSNDVEFGKCGGYPLFNGEKNVVVEDDIIAAEKDDHKSENTEKVENQNNDEGQEDENLADYFKKIRSNPTIVITKNMKTAVVRTIKEEMKTGHFQLQICSTVSICEGLSMFLAGEHQLNVQSDLLKLSTDPFTFDPNSDPPNLLSLLASNDARLVTRDDKHVTLTKGSHFLDPQFSKDTKRPVKDVVRSYNYNELRILTVSWGK